MRSPGPRRAFTLIEMTVVVAMIALLATLVAPRLLALRQGATARAAESKLVADVARAGEVARSRGETILVALDPTAGVVNLSGANPDAENRYSADLNLGAPMTIAAIGPSDSATTLATPVRGEGLAEFYADGSATPATAEVTLGGRSITLRVRGDGTITLGGDAATTTRWTAGTIEQRT